MKKLLSLFIITVVFFELFAIHTPPTLSVTPTTYALTDLSKLDYLSYFGTTYPAYKVPGTLNKTPDKVFVYQMGETIHGKIDITPTAQWKVELINFEGTVIDSMSYIAGKAEFSMLTTNVDRDGRYAFRISSPSNEFPTIDGTQINGLEFYIRYNLTFNKKDITGCLTTGTISGYVTRANGRTILAPIKICLAYPDKSIAAFYEVAPSSSSFSIVYPSDGPDADNKPDIGNYYLYIQDGYSQTLNPDYDAIVYEVLNNIPDTTITLSTYVSPVLLYENQKNQPVLLQLENQDGDYVTGATITVKDVDGNNIYTSIPEDEISKGFYRLVINAGNIAGLRFQASYNPYGVGEIKSNLLIINLRDPGVFNPYVDIKTDYPVPPYGKGPSECTGLLGRKVFDNLPLMIGTAFEIYVDYWPVADSKNWYMYDASTDVAGPLIQIDSNRFLVKESGKISASINMVVWERVNKDCPAWDTSVSISDMSTNAVLHIYSKTFEICEVRSCTYRGVTLIGNIINTTTIEAGKKVDKFVISVDPTGAPPDLTSSAPCFIIHMYMTNGCNILSNAFTVDTSQGGTKNLSEIWINPNNAKDTGIPEIPISFLPASDLTWDILPEIFGVQFNYPTGTDCGNHLVLQFFGTSRKYDSCNNFTITYPLVFEAVDPIDIVSKIVKRDASAVINEGANKPNKLLAGVASTVDITDPHFTLSEPKWEFTLNDRPVQCSVAKTGTGYRISFDEALNDEGTFKIYGYAYNSGFSSKEEVAINIPVSKPKFEVKIGLLDGTLIDNDGIITQGFPEIISLIFTDPRGIYKSIYDLPSGWIFKVKSSTYDFDLPLASCVEAKNLPTTSDNISQGIASLSAVGYDNPNLEGNPNLERDPTFDLYFVGSNKAEIKVCTFKLVPPSVSVEPKEVPFTIPSQRTTIKFNLTDAHSHAAPNVEVLIGFQNQLTNQIEYTKVGKTEKNGELSSPFTPKYSGKYFVGVNGDYLNLLKLPCGWPGNTNLTSFEAIYKAPVVDTEAPTLTVSAPAKVSEPIVKITGKAMDNVGVVSVWIGKKKVDFAQDGTFEGTAELVEGANTVKVIAFDAAGNMGEATVTVIYEKPTFKINSSSSTGGSISPSGIISVNYGDSKTFTITPNSGYKISSVKVDGKSIGPVSSYTFTNITSDHTIEAIFEKEKKETVIILQIGDKNFTVNGETRTLDSPPVIKNNRTLLPIRAVVEALGGTVGWDATEKKVTISLSSTTIELWIGKSIAKVNGINTPIDATNPKVVPEIINGRTLLPLRFVAENLGCTVS